MVCHGLGACCSESESLIKKENEQNPRISTRNAKHITESRCTRDHFMNKSSEDPLDNLTIITRQQPAGGGREAYSYLVCIHHNPADVV